MSSTRPTASQAPVEGTTFHGDGREQELARHLQSRRAELQDNPQAVLDAIDAFGRGKYLMNVGGPKAVLVEDIIRQRQPKLVIELGTYVGYSAIAFGRHLKALHPNGVVPSSWSSLPLHTSGITHPRIGYFCIEQSEEYAAVAQVGIDIAGLGDIVKVLVGPSSATLRDLRKTLALPTDSQIDFVFLDHYKPLYTTDVKILEQDGLIRLGTTLVADNVIKPGNPAYLAYVRAPPSLKRRALVEKRRVVELAPELAQQKHQNNSGVKRSLNTGYEGNEQEVGDERGVPEWVYTSELLESWDPYTAEPDGVEVSRIVGRDD